MALSIASGFSWSRILAVDVPLLEILVRGTLMYIAILVLMRLIVRRQPGAVGISDLLVLVLIADAAQNGMTGGYKSAVDGHHHGVGLRDRLAYHVSPLTRILRPSPLLLVRDGRFVRTNLRRELLTEQEVRGVLRQHGVSDLSTVKRACMEHTGKISVVTAKGSETEPPDESAAKWGTTRLQVTPVQVPLCGLRDRLAQVHLRGVAQLP